MIKAEIAAHSLSPQGDELISVLCTFPRIILAEVNTHRMLSKNTSSSRAIPFKKMVDSVQNDPFVPIAWQKEHKGMQGSEYFIDKDELYHLKDTWLRSRNNIVKEATFLNSMGVTKQLCNRLLEPFMWTTMLITGPRSGWDNFFNLRCPAYEHPYKNKKFKSKEDFNKYDEEVLNKTNNTDLGYNAENEDHWRIVNKGQAEIHIMDLAEKIYDAMNESTPEKLKAGEWHIPFKDKLPELKVAYTDDGLDCKEKCTLEDKIAMSVAMAARTSYTVVGHEKELDAHFLINLHDRLLTQDPPHSSPMEHCARAMDEVEYTSSKATGYTRKGKDQYGWCRNFKGFIPYRHIIEEGKKV